MSTDDAATSKDAGNGKDAETSKDAENTAEVNTSEVDTAEVDTDTESQGVESDEVTDSVVDKADDAAPPAKPALGKDAAADKADKAAAKSSSKAAAPTRASMLPLVAAFVAGVVAVAAITAVVVFFLQGRDRGEKLDAIRDSSNAACTFGKDVSVYDYSQNLDDYFTKVKNGATGEFLKEFDDATKALADAMGQAKVKSWVDDVQCGYQSGDENQAKVLVTLTQYRTNFTQPAPERQFVVVIAQLQKSGDKWLVEKLDSPMLEGTESGLPGAPGAAPQPAPAGQPAPGQPAPTPGN